jgi:hypothetical protein
MTRFVFFARGVQKICRLVVIKRISWLAESQVVFRYSLPLTVTLLRAFFAVLFSTRGLLSSILKKVKIGQ